MKGFEGETSSLGGGSSVLFKGRRGGNERVAPGAVLARASRRRLGAGPWREARDL